MYTDHAAYWDGRTETGETVSSGTYFYPSKQKITQTAEKW